MKRIWLALSIILCVFLASVGEIHAQPSGPVCAPETLRGSGTTTQLASGATHAQIQNAINTLGPGDNLMLQKGGTYNLTQQLNITRDGTANDPILIGAYGTGAMPVLNMHLIPRDGHYRGVALSGANHVIIDGIELRNTDPEDQRNGFALTMINDSNFNVFRRGKINGSRHVCIKIEKGTGANSSDDNKIEFNELINCGTESIYIGTDPLNTCDPSMSDSTPDDGACQDILWRPIVQYNTIIADSHERIEFKPGVRNGIIKGNYVEGGKEGIMVSNWANSSHLNDHQISENMAVGQNDTNPNCLHIRSGADIFDNVCVNTGGSGRAGIQIEDSNPDGFNQPINARFNTVYNASGVGLLKVGTVSSVTISANNLTYASGSGNFGSNPNFVNPASLDFRLQAGSPAEGFGAYLIGEALRPLGHTACLDTDSTLPPGTEVVGDWGFDNVFTDASVAENDCVNTGVTFDATNKITGSHASLFNADTDQLLCGSVGLPADMSAFTIKAWVRPTAFTDTQYIFNHNACTNPSVCDRVQIKTAATSGQLQVGLGNSALVAPAIQALSLNTYYMVVLVVNSGNYRVAVLQSNATTSAGMIKATGTYAGLDTRGPNVCIGSFCEPTSTLGWFGQIDKGRMVNRALTDAEIIALFNTDTGTVLDDPAGPTLVPFDFTTTANASEIGNVANNKAVMALDNPSPNAYDPDECTVLSQFALTYNDVDQAIIECALSGLTVTFTALNSVPNNTVVVKLYRNRGLGDEQEITLDNNATTPVDPEVELLQDATWRFAAPGHDPGTRWIKHAGMALNPPSPAYVIIGRVLIKNMSAVNVAPRTQYGLWCTEGAYGDGSTAVRLTASTDDFPLAYRPQGDTTRTDGDLTTNLAGFPMPAGITFASGGTVNALPTLASLAEIPALSGLVFEPILQLKEGIDEGDTIECCYRIEPDGQPLDDCDPLRMVVGRAKSR